MQSIFYVMYPFPFTHGNPDDTTYPERQRTSHARWPACIRQWVYDQDLKTLSSLKGSFFEAESRWLEEGFDQNARHYWRFDELARDSCRSLLKEIHQSMWLGIELLRWERQWLPKPTTPDLVIGVMDKFFGKHSVFRC
jgi:hypothetical protein